MKQLQGICIGFDGPLILLCAYIRALRAIFGNSVIGDKANDKTRARVPGIRESQSKRENVSRCAGFLGRSVLQCGAFVL